MKNKLYLLFGFALFLFIFISFDCDSYADTQYYYERFLIYHNNIDGDIPLRCCYTITIPYDDVKVCSYGNIYNGNINHLSFYVSKNFGEQIPTKQNYNLDFTYSIHQVFYKVSDGSIYQEWSNDNMGLQTSNTLICYHQDYYGLYYYEIEDITPLDGENLSLTIPTISGCPYYDNSLAVYEYLFTGTTDAPDFNDYTYSQYLSCTFSGFPYGGFIDFGVGNLNALYFWYSGMADTVIGENVYIRFVGLNGDEYVIPTLDNIGYFSNRTHSISSLVAPDSKFYAICTPFNSTTKIYGDSIILEFNIDGSIFGNIIRSFGSSDSNYYDSTLNVNGSNKTINYIGSNIVYKSNANPNSYTYSFLNNIDKGNYSTNYYPVFNDYSSFTDNDFQYIDEHYNNNDISIIEEDTKTEFNFELNISDISSNDIQKVVDDSQNLFGLIGNLFPLIASMFAVCFPFIMFNIPGALLIIGGLLAGGALVGLAIKFINFIRGS